VAIIIGISFTHRKCQLSLLIFNCKQFAQHIPTDVKIGADDNMNYLYKNITRTHPLAGGFGTPSAGCGSN